jgi:hypothetical protein
MLCPIPASTATALNQSTFAELFNADKVRKMNLGVRRLAAAFTVGTTPRSGLLGTLSARQHSFEFPILGLLHARVGLGVALNSSTHEFFPS